MSHLVLTCERIYPGITYTVGTYSPGKLSVVYEISIQVLPTVPSPTTTHLMGLPEDISVKEKTRTNKIPCTYLMIITF